MSVGATAFGLDGDRTHQKHYSSKKPNPLTSHVGQQGQGDKTHFAPLKPSLPALVAAPLSAMETSAQQCLGQALSTERPKSRSCACHRSKTFGEASPSLVNFPASWSVKFHNDLNGSCLHQTHSINGLKLLNISCCKYLEMLFGMDRELEI